MEASSRIDSVNNLGIALSSGESQGPLNELSKFPVVDDLSLPSRIGVVMESIGVLRQLVEFLYLLPLQYLV